jgi:adenylate cyclase
MPQRIALEHRMRYRFEDYALDTDRRELCRRGDVVRLEPQAFDLLEYLIRNRERVLSRDDLIAAIWRGRIVSDSAITTRINAARYAIGDTGKVQRFIKTVPRKGIRFVGTVEEEGGGRPGPDVGLQSTTSHPALPDKPSIAVLAFANMSGDPAQEYFSDGVTEDIITELSRFSELLVIARNSSFQYKGRPIDVRQVGRELGVRYVLEGSIRRAGDRVRISAQLIDAVTGAHHWAERYDHKLEDVFAVQDEVACTIVSVLAVHVNKAETERVLATPPATWQAYEHYLQAADTLVAYHSSLDKADLVRSRRGLRRALDIDPNYARAHAALSRTYVSLWAHRWDDDCPWPAALDRAHQSGREAVRLAPNLPAAHVALGFALVWMRQHEAAISEFERAAVLNPNLTDFLFAWTLVVAGEPARAIQTLKAHMRLDPFYLPFAPWWLGSAYYMLGRYADAVPPLQAAVLRAPNLALGRHWLAATYAQLGQLDKARVEMAEGLRVQPWFTISEMPFTRTCKRPEDGERLKDGLRKAGYPE